jgi:hypothetical protein
MQKGGYQGFFTNTFKEEDRPTINAFNKRFLEQWNSKMCDQSFWFMVFYFENPGVVQVHIWNKMGDHGWQAVEKKALVNMKGKVGEKLKFSINKGWGASKIGMWEAVMNFWGTLYDRINEKRENEQPRMRLLSTIIS